MLIAIMLVALAGGAASARIAAAPAAPPPPPLHIALMLARDVSPSLADKMIAEADAVWRPMGITFAWQMLDPRRPGAPLTVIVDDDRGGAGSSRLGWILFDEHNVPDHVLHVSYANAVSLLEQSRTVVGNVNAMPIAERETYLGRAMGRALAHELGHYLLASKTHTATGLMTAILNAEQLFSPMRNRFDVPAALCKTVVTRLGRSQSTVMSP